jgi:protein-S-isoprenylcysteine O-methyltransferase Ste14
LSQNKETKKRKDHAGVLIPPPLCFLFFLVFGILFNSYWLDGTLGPALQIFAGFGIVIVALLFVFIIARSHEKSGSNVEPWKPTTVVLKKGFYRFSRNPIYVFMTVGYVGFSIAAGSWLALALLPGALLIIRYHVIAREERYLEEKFGDEYLSYKATVRRWL